MTDAASTTLEDWGKLLLRLSLGGLMLFHGIGKLGSGGIDGITQMVTAKGLPEAVAYGVYVGEVVAPILIIAGLLTRLAGFVFAFNMAIAIWLAHSADLLTLTEMGAPKLELQYLYLIGGLAIGCLGGGRLVIGKRG
ncbi:MAG: DoxX family protein [Planctomycetes bacterium]|nr:DoxX family protein [Planctomycetota bacterium]